MKCLVNKNSLVTGSSRGIGKAIAIELAKKGSNIMLHSSSSTNNCDELIENMKTYGIKVGYVSGDLSKKEDMDKIYQETIRQLGDIDIFVANASMQIESPTWLNATEWGRVLTIGSIQQEKPHYEMIPYALSKSAQMNFVKNLAKIVAADNVLVNNLAPGTIDTDRNKSRMENKDLLNELLSGIPLKRAALPEEVAKLAAFLCTDDASYITGSNFFVDGGASL